jgi:dihydropteroate synthase
VKHHTVNIGGLKVGAGFPPRIMSVINLSPESFYRDSIVDKNKMVLTSLMSGAHQPHQEKSMVLPR